MSSPILFGGVGFSIGLLTGLVGIGGGFLFVPALVLIAGLSMKRAVGTSLVVITLNAAAGFAGYLGRVPIHWTVVLVFLAAGSLGAAGGVVLTRAVPQRQLQRRLRRVRGRHRQLHALSRGDLVAAAAYSCGERQTVSDKVSTSEGKAS